MKLLLDQGLPRTAAPLLRVMAECGEALQRGAAVTVEPGRIRLRYLPLGAAGE
jgi:hypothetical protein